MGGEPLCEENIFLIFIIITMIKTVLPYIKIYIWTGYLYEELKESQNILIRNILNEADVLIDGPYIEEERDITLPMRGSRNQKIWNLKTGEIIKYDQ